MICLTYPNQTIFVFLIILSGAAHINDCLEQTSIWAVSGSHRSTAHINGTLLQTFSKEPKLKSKFIQKNYLWWLEESTEILKEVLWIYIVYWCSIVFIVRFSMHFLSSWKSTCEKYSASFRQVGDWILWILVNNCYRYFLGSNWV